MVLRILSDGTRFFLAMVLSFASAGCVRTPRPEPPPVSSAAPAPEPGLAPPGEQSPSVSADWQTYAVQPGDTLAWIADCRRVSVGTLAHVNGISDPDRIAAGAQILVPAEDLCAAARAVPLARARTEARPAGAEGERSQPAPTTTAPRLAAALQRGEELLETARSRYEAADFDGALRGAEAASEAFARASGSPAASTRRAHAHILAAMAAAGLGERERAVAEFGRAFALDPSVGLAPADRSPRLVELEQLARSGGGP